MRLRFFSRSLCILSLVVGTATANAIVIDGSIDDWDSIPRVSFPPRMSAPDSPFGTIEYLKLAVDDDFIYFLISFAVPRPFEAMGRPLRLNPGVWDDFTYIELDVNRDGVWDYKTRMAEGKKPGLNNLLILEADGLGDAGQVLLQPEGHKDYFPLGPRGQFARSGWAVELRIPRLPLSLTEGMINFRACITYRDVVQGSGLWVSDYFPSRGWFGCPVPALAAQISDREIPLSLNRLLEPAQIRDPGSERFVSGATRRFRPPYVYPRVTPTPFWNYGESEKDAEQEEAPQEVAPVIIIDPQRIAPPAARQPSPRAAPPSATRASPSPLAPPANIPLSSPGTILPRRTQPQTTPAQPPAARQAPAPRPPGDE